MGAKSGMHCEGKRMTKVMMQSKGISMDKCAGSCQSRRSVTKTRSKTASLPAGGSVSLVLDCTVSIRRDIACLAGQRHNPASQGQKQYICPSSAIADVNVSFCEIGCCCCLVHSLAVELDSVMAMAEVLP